MQMSLTNLVVLTSSRNILSFRKVASVRNVMTLEKVTTSRNLNLTSLSNMLYALT